MRGWTAYKRENIKALVSQRDHLGSLVGNPRAAVSHTAGSVAYCRRTANPWRSEPPRSICPSSRAAAVRCVTRYSSSIAEQLEDVVATSGCWRGRNRSGKDRRRGTGRGEIRGAHRQIHLSHRSPPLSKARP